MMIEVLKRNWWALAIRGVLGVVFGVLVLFFPAAAVIVLVVLFGAYAAVDGLFAIVSALLAAKAHERWWPFVLEGIVGLGIGAVTFYRPGMTAFALYLLIASWAVATGILEIVAAIRVRATIANEVMLLVSGIASILFGALMVIFPMVGWLAIAWLIGFYAILFGMLMIAFSLRVRGLAA
ncbi:MAG TPA: DUF308 domain-containing protein [Candidatus Tyrphobacter sp.]